MVVLVQHVVLSGSWFDRVGVGRNLLVVRTRGGPCCVLVFVVQVLGMQVVQQRPNCLRGCRGSGVLGIVLCVDWTSVAAELCRSMCGGAIGCIHRGAQIPDGKWLGKCGLRTVMGKCGGSSSMDKWKLVPNVGKEVAWSLVEL